MTTIVFIVIISILVIVGIGMQIILLVCHPTYKDGTSVFESSKARRFCMWAILAEIPVFGPIIGYHVFRGDYVILFVFCVIAYTLLMLYIAQRIDERQKSQV